jgi:glucosamine--fructose-6-phosphate aminotransferase (isomerizing)
MANQLVVQTLHLWFNIEINMCGIFVYYGDLENAAELVLAGLKRLDYRGYDSWGIGFLEKGKIKVIKKVGKINSEKFHFPAVSMAMGHTRWATHGSVSERNAHPHFSSDRRFILAQNGIVDNADVLKKILMKSGYRFISETDTEVIVRLIEKNVKIFGDMEQAIKISFKQIRGRNTIVVLTDKGEIFAVRSGSPLIIGNNRNGIFLSSDLISLAGSAKKAMVLDNHQMVIIKKGKLVIKNIITNRNIKKSFLSISLKGKEILKNGFQHYMLKEIYDTPSAIQAICQTSKEDLSEFLSVVKNSRKIFVIGSGTAGIAAEQIAYYLRTIAKLDATGLIGAESLSYYNLFSNQDIVIAISQSGETADVLEVLEYAKKKRIPIASYVNMPGSSISRLSDYPFMAGAGAEICVLSTKVFVSQIAWGYLIAKTLIGGFDNAKQELKAMQIKVKEYLSQERGSNSLKEIASRLIDKPNIFLIGKAENLQIVKEGMVKIIEGSYIHAHAIPAGDLKHYAITIIEKGVPVIAVISEDMVQDDMKNAISQVKARGATVIAIANHRFPDVEMLIKVPKIDGTGAIFNIIPLQLIAYWLSVQLGHDVDKPRNIAKSVTVK